MVISVLILSVMVYGQELGGDGLLGDEGLVVALSPGTGTAICCVLGATCVIQEKLQIENTKLKNYCIVCQI